MNKFLGIDVGGTGVKAAIVDVQTGQLLSERKKIKTPIPATPEAVIQVISELVNTFEWNNKPFGLCFPSVIQDGIVLTASNIDKSWLGYNLEEQISNYFGAPITALNDADCAGVAELTFGAGKGVMGTVIMLTLGTGIGSGLFYNGELIPNTEFGHLLYKTSIWEDYASNRARESKELGWKEWAKELNAYLNHIEFLFTPNLIILGGGVSKKFSLYEKYIHIKSNLQTAQMLNSAGIIGAAYLAGKKQNQ